MTHRHILKQDSEGEEKEMCVLSGSIQHAGKKKFRQRKVNKNAFPISLFLPRVASLEKLFCFFFFFVFCTPAKGFAESLCSGKDGGETRVGKWQ